MAELHVQEKKRSALPWILAAVVVLALLFWYFQGRGNSADVGAANTTDTTMVGAAPTDAASGTAVTQYVQFVANNRAQNAASPSHDYTADGLRQLAAALNEVSANFTTTGVDLQQRIDAIRQRADAMQQNPTSLDHSLQTREAFSVAAGVIEQMRGNDTTGTATGATGTMAPSAVTGTATGTATGNTGTLLEAATAIEPSRPLLDQIPQVERFFSQAADALQTLSSAPR